LVLYVDDERPNRIVFEQNVKAEFRVKSVPDASTALAVLASEEVAVLVSDIRMPQIDGLELLRIVKEKYPDTLRMVITAFSDIDPILAALNEGLVSRYIVKPFVAREVRQALRWACELFVLGKQAREVLMRILHNERLASLGSFTALYVHDLKNPIMAAEATVAELKLFLDDIPEVRNAIEKAPIDPSTKEKLLGKVATAAEMVGEAADATKVVRDMIWDLKEFLEPPKGQVVRPLIDPKKVIEKVLKMFAQVQVHRDTALRYDGPDELPQIRMKSIALTQVMLNLVGNASQAVQARRESNHKVEVIARPIGDMLEVKIQDDGVGMPPEVLERVGSPFFTTRAEGTGLGIANCQRLVGSAGGRILIESTQGVGTTVTLLLPIAA
jgi:signal transduction histidine kinase